MREEAIVRIGFIGLGNMGNPMACNLLKAGYDLAIHDVCREAGHNLENAGAQWEGNPKAVAVRSDVVCTSLPGPSEVETVVLGDDGVFAGLRGGEGYIDLSTNSPAMVRRLAEIGDEQGLRVLDAPVSGGVFGARDGTLTIFVGGKSRDFEHFQPLLQCMGKNVVYMGPAGAGSVTKLVNNTMLFINLMAACESLAMGAEAGLRPQALFEVITTGMGQSKALDTHVQLALKGEAISSSIDSAAEDIHLGLELAKEMGTPSELTSLVDAAFTQLCDAGLGKADQTEVVREFMRQADVDLFEN